MTAKPTPTQAASKATNEAIEKSQEMFAKSTAASEKTVEGLIEVNASAFKGSELVAKKMYDNYVSNMAAVFDGAKSLAKTTDVAEFYKAATSNATKASETFAAQSKELTELSTKAFKDNSEVVKKFYAEAFKAA